MDKTPLLENIIDSLQKEKVRQDAFDEPDHSYKIETRIDINERECCFSSVVTYDGLEITDDPELIKEATCRQCVADISKTKALSKLLVKEAASLHFERCEAVRHRLNRKGREPLTMNRNTALALMMVLAVAIVLSAVYFSQSLIQPTALPPDAVETPPPVASPLEKTDLASPFEVGDHISGPIDRTSPPATATQVLEEDDSSKSPAVSAGSSNDVPPFPNTVPMEQSPGPPPQQTENPQVMKDLSPEEIKERVRSILENKIESP